MIERLEKFLTELPFVVILVDWSKTHSLPGLSNIPIYNIIEFIWKETQEDILVTRSNSMAFSFFLALFPSIIFLFTLLAYTPLYANFAPVLQSSISEVMPGKSGKMIFDTIKDIATKQRGGLLSFGFFLALWFSSNGMLDMMGGLEKDYPGTFKKRNIIEKRLRAIQLTFLLALILVASVVLVILGNNILAFVFGYIHMGGLSKLTFTLFRWVTVIALFYAGISIIYRFGSPTIRRTRYINSGATLATSLSILTSWGFSFYADNFASYNKVYGSIGTLIVLLIWIQLNCFILLIGFELNTSIAVIKQRKRAHDAELSDER